MAWRRFSRLRGSLSAPGERANAPAVALGGAAALRGRRAAGIAPLAHLFLTLEATRLVFGVKQRGLGGGAALL
jgi:hypothetical protein